MMRKPHGWTAAILVTVLAVAVTFWASGSRAQWERRVLVIGDSLTYGASLDDPTQRWTTRLAALTGAFVQELARNGWKATEVATIAPALMETYIPPHTRSDVTVIVVLGTNDWGRGNTLAEFRVAYRKIMASIDGTRVLCVTPPERYMELATRLFPRKGGELEEFRQVIRNECTGEVLEGPSVMPLLPQFRADGLHLSPCGTAVLAEAIASWILESHRQAAEGDRPKQLRDAPSDGFVAD